MRQQSFKDTLKLSGDIMEKPISSAPASGMRDLVPNEVALRDWAIGIITESYQQFGFTRIETPIMEKAEKIFS
jgi:histidyl-tRNA synthetase